MRCPDRSCKRVPSQCKPFVPGRSRKCTRPSARYECFDGSCRNASRYCATPPFAPSVCSEDHTRCSDGLCVSNISMCPDIPACMNDLAGRSSAKRCPDGSCVHHSFPCVPSRIVCSEGVLCPDGVCRNGPCPAFSGCAGERPIQCPSGDCVSSVDECVNNCPSFELTNLVTRYKISLPRFRCADGTCKLWGDNGYMSRSEFERAANRSGFGVRQVISRAGGFCSIAARDENSPAVVVSVSPTAGVQNGLASGGPFPVVGLETSGNTPPAVRVYIPPDVVAAETSLIGMELGGVATSNVIDVLSPVPVGRRVGAPCDKVSGGCVFPDKAGIMPMFNVSYLTWSEATLSATLSVKVAEMTGESSGRRLHSISDRLNKPITVEMRVDIPPSVSRRDVCLAVIDPVSNEMYPVDRDIKFILEGQLASGKTDRIGYHAMLYCPYDHQVPRRAYNPAITGGDDGDGAHSCSSSCLERAYDFNVTMPGWCLEGCIPKCGCFEGSDAPSACMASCKDNTLPGSFWPMPGAAILSGIFGALLVIAFVGYRQIKHWKKFRMIKERQKMFEMPSGVGVPPQESKLEVVINPMLAQQQDRIASRYEHVQSELSSLKKKDQEQTRAGDERRREDEKSVSEAMAKLRALETKRATLQGELQRFRKIAKDKAEMKRRIAERHRRPGGGGSASDGGAIGFV